MRNLNRRAVVYAETRMRELTENSSSEEIEAVIASAFRDGALVAEEEARNDHGVRGRR